MNSLKNSRDKILDIKKSYKESEGYKNGYNLKDITSQRYQNKKHFGQQYFESFLGMLDYVIEELDKKIKEVGSAEKGRIFDDLNNRPVVEVFSTLELNVSNHDEIPSWRKVKKQYRILAKKYHPDTGGEYASDEKFQEVSEAHDLLEKWYKDNNYEL